MYRNMNHSYVPWHDEFKYVCMYVCVCIYVYVGAVVCVCIFVCVWTCVCVGVCVSAYVTWLIHMGQDMSHAYVPWLILCAMTQVYVSYMRHDSFICAMTWQFTCTVTHSCVTWLFLCTLYVTWLIYRYCQAAAPLRSFICVTWLIHIWHDSFKFVTLLVHIFWITHSHVLPGGGSSAADLTYERFLRRAISEDLSSGSWISASTLCCAWHDSCVCVTALIHVRDFAHACMCDTMCASVRRILCAYGVWGIYMLDVTRVYEWNDSNTRTHVNIYIYICIYT